MKRLTLARPHAVVAVPRSVQLACLSVALAAVAGALLALSPLVSASVSFGLRHALCCAVGAAGIAFLARPSTWRPWVRAAADPYGVYLRGRNGLWHCVRWRHVRALDVDPRSRAAGLVVQARLPEDERKALAAGSWIFDGAGEQERALRLSVPGTRQAADHHRANFERVRDAA